MNESEAKFTWAVGEIEREYTRLKQRLGWRFLLSPRQTFMRGARTALISFHPGGASESPDQPKASSEAGSAYLLESWHGCAPGTSPLQVQVLRMLESLGERPDATLSAYFVPYRAPSGDAMVETEDSLKFAVRLWNELLPFLDPKVLVVLGGDTFDGISQVLGRPDHELKKLVHWGKQTATLAQFGDRLVVRYPHLSQFKIFSRAESRPAVDDIARRVEAFRKGSDAWRR